MNSTQSNARLAYVVDKLTEELAPAHSITGRLSDITRAAELMKPSSMIIGLNRKTPKGLKTGITHLTFIYYRPEIPELVRHCEGNPNSRSISKTEIHYTLEHCWDQAIELKQEAATSADMSQWIETLLTPPNREQIYLLLAAANDPRPKPYDPFEL